MRMNGTIGTVSLSPSSRDSIADVIYLPSAWCRQQFPLALPSRRGFSFQKKELLSLSIGNKPRICPPHSEIWGWQARSKEGSYSTIYILLGASWSRLLIHVHVSNLMKSTGNRVIVIELSLMGICRRHGWQHKRATWSRIAARTVVRRENEPLICVAVLIQIVPDYTKNRLRISKRGCSSSSQWPSWTCSFSTEISSLTGYKGLPLSALCLQIWRM